MRVECVVVRVECGCEGGLLLVSMECVVGRVECYW